MAVIPVKKSLNQISNSSDELFIDALQSSYLYQDSGGIGGGLASEIRKFQLSIAIESIGESGRVQNGIECFDESEIAAIKSRKEEFSLIHLGAILFSVTCLFKIKGNVEGRLCYLDGRFEDIKQARQSSFKFNLNRGQAHFVYFPDYPISISDPNLGKASQYLFEYGGLSMLKGSHAFNVNIGYIYRFTNQGDIASFSKIAREIQSQEILGVKRMDESEESLLDWDLNQKPATLRSDTCQEICRKGLFRRNRKLRVRHYAVSGSENFGSRMEHPRCSSRPFQGEGSSSASSYNSGRNSIPDLQNLKYISSQKAIQLGKELIRSASTRSDIYLPTEVWEQVFCNQQNEYSQTTSGADSSGDRGASLEPDRSSKCTADGANGGQSSGESEPINHQESYTEPLPGLSDREHSHSGNEQGNSIPECESDGANSNLHRVKLASKSAANFQFKRFCPHCGSLGCNSH
ncbi:movement protein [rubber tree virus 1]|uniref:Movement protein n=1 Tax=rubber tree virus 1 TaxID=3071279 RepID=A0AAE6UIS4_9VIRU|nr:movement protein [rubber tree virus 1]QGR26012.1 movement protein [rubber tree virus 1]